MTKQSKKAIVKRLKSCNNFLKIRNNASQSTDKKQHKACLNLSPMDKKEYFSNLDRKHVTDDKKFENQ